MMKLIETQSGKIMFTSYPDQYENIHLIHCSETLENIKLDVATPYIVAEECTNFARVHLVTDFSEDEALQQIGQYLIEKEDCDPDETHLIGAFKCTID